MATKIEKKIVEFKVVDEESANTTQAAPAVEHMHANVERPELLLGSTYKIKTPLSEHALYVTINDVILNEGTEHESRRPFEIFINSKNMDHFQWVVALTRVISAVFRIGGDVSYLSDELKAVFDPKGGYFKKGGKFMPSLVAEIGDAIESHMKMIGLIDDDNLDDHQKNFIKKKREEYESINGGSGHEKKNKEVRDDSVAFPEGAQLCQKCNTNALVMMDGCMTLNCGDSKCG